jgi:nucleotide-binding universal stress UspA family protein
MFNVMKTIIAPTDFSAISLNAVNYAADLAAAINADIVILNVVQMPITVAAISVTEFGYEEMVDAAEDELSSLSSRLLSRTKNKIHIDAKLMIGSLEQDLQEICKKQKPFAVVMGTRGAGAIERFFVGSNTVFAVNNLPYPVLVVPENASFNGISKMALASDLKDIESMKPIEVLKSWLQTFESELEIINVADDENLKATALPASVSLQNVFSEFQTRFSFVAKQKIEEGVYKFAEENKPDLLVVIPKKHGLMAGIFHKSKSKPFILHPRVPVLSIAE